MKTFFRNVYEEIRATITVWIFLREYKRAVKESNKEKQMINGEGNQYVQ